MQTIHIEALDGQLATLIDRASAGEEIIIARAGKPLAKLGPVSPPARKANRVLGALIGQFTVSDDFDAALPGSVLEDFERS